MKPILGLWRNPALSAALTVFSVNQAPSRSGAAHTEINFNKQTNKQTIEPLKKPGVPLRSLFVTFDIIDFDIDNFSVLTTIAE